MAIGTVAGAIALVGAAPASGAKPTGRHLVTFEKASTARSASALGAVLARTGVRRAGRGVPELRIATVRGSAAAIAKLRGDPSVRSVSVEWERDLRRTPSDPALVTPETEFTTGVPAGTTIQWQAARQGLMRAWDLTTGSRAIVGALDTGVDGGNPEFAGKIASADAAGTAGPLTDEDGHGSHTAGLACVGTDNGIGLAGAGFACRLAVVKLGSTITGGIRDEDIADGIRIATDRGADAINMSFGGGVTNTVLRQVIEYAVSKGVVLVAAASNDPLEDQGAPAVELQPGDAPNLGAGRGLVVTAAEFDETRAGTGLGNQISLAAYGFFDDGALGPPGLISTYPRGTTPREGTPPLAGCDCRRALADGPLRLPAGHLDGRPTGRGPGGAHLRFEPVSHPARQAHAAQADSPPLRGLEPRAGLGDHRRRRCDRGRTAHRPAAAGVEGPRAQARPAAARQEAAAGVGALVGLRSRWRAQPRCLPRARLRPLREARPRPLPAPAPRHQAPLGGAHAAPRHVSLLHPRPRQGGQPRGGTQARGCTSGGQAAAVEADLAASLSSASDSSRNPAKRSRSGIAS